MNKKSKRIFFTVFAWLFFCLSFCFCIHAEQDQQNLPINGIGKKEYVVVSSKNDAILSKLGQVYEKLRLFAVYPTAVLGSRLSYPTPLPHIIS